MMIPWEVTIIPNYLTIKAWGWMDSYQGLIVPFMAGAFGVFSLRQFFCDSRVSCLMRPKSTGAVISAVICPWCRRCPGLPLPPWRCIPSLRTGITFVAAFDHEPGLDANRADRGGYPRMRR